MLPILFEITDGVAFITLNRPEKFNSFNREMALLLQSHLDECAALLTIRAVCITGAGKAFCAGQDISELTGQHKLEIKQILAEHYNPIVKKIRQLPKPVIAAVNGVAAGAGANIALCCDIVVATEAASFIQAFSKIGLIPDSGGTYTLPRLIGWQKASALMLTGDKVTAAEAEKMGMIYKVLDAAVFNDQYRQLALQIAQMPTQALAYTKHALNCSFNNTWQEQLTLEDEYQQKAAATADFQEGITAFIEKKTPLFKGC
jgi:2-(1,2-epoxy-1,2-dihydrophenyl)acetyl-CoA isomerase